MTTKELINQARNYDSLLPANLTYGIPKEELYIKYGVNMNEEKIEILTNGIK